MTVRILRSVTGCAAAVSIALLAGGVVLSYAYRHIGPLTRWDFSDVVEETTFIALPVAGYILASKRPGNRVGWIALGAGLAIGLGFFCDRYGRGGLAGASGGCREPGRPRGSRTRPGPRFRRRGWPSSSCCSRPGG